MVKNVTKHSSDKPQTLKRMNDKDHCNNTEL
jgi:hypothetical protein